jgi:phage gp36-like protein
MRYATVADLALAATGGWADLAQRACPGPGVEPGLMDAEAVALAQAGLLRAHAVLDMASRHVDTYLYPRYRQTMPLAPEVVAASSLPAVVAAIALRRLYGHDVPEDVRNGTRWADDYLVQLSKGVVSLGAVDTVVAQPAGHTVARAPAKAFDWAGY